MKYTFRIGRLTLIFFLWVVGCQTVNAFQRGSESGSEKISNPAYKSTSVEYSHAVSNQVKALKAIVDTALANHPMMAKAEANLQKSRASARANARPLYNPEIALDYESNVEDTRTLGLSQTIDWSDKQAAQGRIGQRNLLAAEAQYNATRQSLMVEILKSINRFQYFELALLLNQKQTNRLQEFIDIAKKRFAVGDINAIELDLALLTAGEISLNSAKIQSDHYQAKLELEALFNFEPQTIPRLNSDLIQLPQISAQKLVIAHPRLKQYQQLKEAAKSAIKLAERNAKPDPTVSVNAGKEGSQNIVSLGFSMPIFVRNNWSAEIDAAIAESVVVEQDYLNIYRQLLVNIKSSDRRLKLTYQAYQAWQAQNQSGLLRRSQQLQKLWKSGDLATSDYLIQIQQSLDTQIAAAKIKAELMNAWFDYQLASGQIGHWLDLSSKIR